jgi:Tfp pilus assembly protein FimT
MAIIIAVLVIIVGMAAWDMRNTYQNTEQAVERLKTERQELSGRLQSAQSAAAEISTNRGLREEVRNKFSVAKPGERVIVLNDSNKDRATTSDQERQGFWQRISETIWPF